MTALSEGKKAERRVRITLEGRVVLENDVAVYVDTEGTTSRIVKNAGVSVEELATPYDWRDGDVVQIVSRHDDTFTLTRASQIGDAGLGEWLNSAGRLRWTDENVTWVVDGTQASDSYPTVRVLRYQAGGVGS